MAIRENANGIIFENRHASFTLDKKSATVTSVINRYTNEEISSPAEVPYFVYIEALDETVIPPTSAELAEGNIRFTFENGMVLNAVIECFDDFFTFEVVSSLDKSVRGVHFANINTTLTKNCGYVLNGVGMSA